MGQAGLSPRWATSAAFLALCLVALCGCAEPGAPAHVAKLAPDQVVPGSLLPPAPVTPRPALRDTCGALALAGLIGKPRTQIPVPVDLSRRRVACTACPVAPDVRLDRVTILFDTHTGLVTKVTCG